MILRNRFYLSWTLSIHNLVISVHHPLVAHLCAPLCFTAWTWVPASYVRSGSSIGEAYAASKSEQAQVRIWGWGSSQRTRSFGELNLRLSNSSCKSALSFTKPWQADLPIGNSVATWLPASRAATCHYSLCVIKHLRAFTFDSKLSTKIWYIKFTDSQSWASVNIEIGMLSKVLGSRFFFRQQGQHTTRLSSW